MRVFLRFTIDCDVDAAWRALHSPAALAQLDGPFVTMTSLDDLPTSWTPGDDAIIGLAVGPVPLGTQLIDVSESEREHRGQRVRILRDSGIPLTGPLSTLDVWDHQMAVSPAPDDPTRTLWRERLVIGGRTAPALWPALWTVWQWREARIRALAPTWAHDPAPAATPDDPTGHVLRARNEEISPDE
ncbi:hypothetical protein PU630_02225 [Microbacterium horticulturae]|uniref:Polyketide cyclase / dehydrase and lipid transport n=1 Tax=Microbacterium horticulturae TaxID=3028316 RepID=A0ABY8C0Y5_9MICO|nr:hypothetical protein [Microbacterium sp. KACC 23027]WEG09407.1 hypothetical protein PU630_02225 [Microbacterium sp. KACC 23027]